MNRKLSVFSTGGINDLIPTSNMQWMDIQKNTFKNWVNEQLKPRGIVVNDLRTDLADCLSSLVEVLQRATLVGTTSKPDNQYTRLQNITVALNAVSDDGVRIVNIDSSDIADGNLKLILALIWQLILRYQIGFSNIQDKTWMLAWFQAVLPKCKINNLTTDWNDGIALNALVDFCLPGLSPKWMYLDKSDRIDNCYYAMTQAKHQFGIPLIIRPEHMASTELDEMSAITYLSYFIKVGAPGYNATLQRIQPIVQNVPVFNFTTDWNDGRVLTELVTNLGAKIPDTSHKNIPNIQRIQEGIDGGRRLGVEPLLTASDIAEEDQEHLGIMAYAAKFLYMNPQTSTINSTGATTNGVTTVYEEERRISKRSIPNASYTTTSVSSNVVNGDVTTFKISASPELSRNVEYSKPLKIDTNYHVEKRFTDNGPSSFTIVDKEQAADDTFNFVRIPSLRKGKGKRYATDTLDTVSNSGVKVDTYSVGVMISTTSHEIISKDEVYVEAESPNGRVIKLTGDGSYNAQFTPDEIGEWKVSLYCHGKLIDSSPIDVCDPSQVKVTGLKGGLVNKRQTFTIDCRNAGNGELEVVVIFRDSRIPCVLKEIEPSLFEAGYMPFSCGVYHVTVHFNKSEIRDSDYLLGSDSDGMHRRAVFYTTIDPNRDQYNVKTSCDWQIDYITGGPFEVYITDKADIKVYSMQDGTVCNYPHLIADCSGLDPAPIKAEVSYKGHKYNANVVEDEPGIYKINFQPRGKGTYKVWITYDGRIVKGSPFIQEIEELTPKVAGEGLVRGREGHECKFNIDARGFPGELTVTVEGPHFPINCNVITNEEGTHTASYVPEECGPHRIHIKLDGKDIDDSPYRPLIVDPSKIRVSGGWRPLLDEHNRIPLVVNKEKQIPFDASEAGLGELTAEVHGPSYKVPSAIDSRVGGKHTLIFTPREEGRHYIDVKWCEFPISKKPFEGHAVRLPESDSNIQPVISPVVLMQQREHSPKPHDFEDSPNRQNYHLIHPTYKHQPQQQRPREFETVQTSIYHQPPKDKPVQHETYPANNKPKTVKHNPLQYNSFPDTNSNRSETEVKYYPSNTETTEYPSFSHDKPTQQQTVIYTTVPSDQDSGSVRGRLSDDMDGPWVSTENRKPSTIYVAKRDRKKKKKKRRPSGSSVSSTSSSSSDDTIRRDPPSKISVVRKVVEPRMKLLSVVPKEEEVTVIRPVSPAIRSYATDSMISPVRTYSTGTVVRPVRRVTTPVVTPVQRINTIPVVQTMRPVPVVRTVETRPVVRTVQAAPVIRTIETAPVVTRVKPVTPASSLTLVRKDSMTDSTPHLLVPRSTISIPSTMTSSISDPDRIIYRTPKVYTTYIQNRSPSFSSRSSKSPSRTHSFKDSTLSPRSNPETRKDPKVVLSGKGLKQAFVNKEASFSVDGKEAGYGKPTARLFSTNREVPVYLEQTGPELYHGTYTPDQAGAYLLDIKWNDKNLKCCPFKINVNPAYYPEKVDVKGHEMKRAVIGKDFKIHLDPRKAGKGKLTAKCAGPSKQKVPVILKENVDGTTHLSVKPVETGRHILSIKYNKDHVLGSPYAIDVRVQQKNGDVSVHGPGIEHSGVLGEYESHFWVDARDAGSGELNVSVIGPKGAFNVEMKRDSQKDKIFLCRYNPTEPGNYTITVKWSGRHVGESPYRIFLGESRDDLDRFIYELNRSESGHDTILY